MEEVKEEIQRKQTKRKATRPLPTTTVRKKRVLPVITTLPVIADCAILLGGEYRFRYMKEWQLGSLHNPWTDEDFIQKYQLSNLMQDLGDLEDWSVTQDNSPLLSLPVSQWMREIESVPSVKLKPTIRINDSVEYDAFQRKYNTSPCEIQCQMHGAAIDHSFVEELQKHVANEFSSTLVLVGGFDIDKWDSLPGSVTVHRDTMHDHDVVAVTPPPPIIVMNVHTFLHLMDNVAKTYTFNGELMLSPDQDHWFFRRSWKYCVVTGQHIVTENRRLIPLLNLLPIQFRWLVIFSEWTSTVKIPFASIASLFQLSLQGKSYFSNRALSSLFQTVTPGDTISLCRYILHYCIRSRYFYTEGQNQWGASNVPAKQLAFQQISISLDAKERRKYNKQCSDVANYHKDPLYPLRKRGRASSILTSNWTWFPKDVAKGLIVSYMTSYLEDQRLIYTNIKSSAEAQLQTLNNMTRIEQNLESIQVNDTKQKFSDFFEAIRMRHLLTTEHTSEEKKRSYLEAKININQHEIMIVTNEVKLIEERLAPKLDACQDVGQLYQITLPCYDTMSVDSPRPSQQNCSHFPSMHFCFVPGSLTAILSCYYTSVIVNLFVFLMKLPKSSKKGMLLFPTAMGAAVGHELAKVWTSWWSQSPACPFQFVSMSQEAPSRTIHNEEYAFVAVVGISASSTRARLLRTIRHLALDSPRNVIENTQTPKEKLPVYVMEYGNWSQQLASLAVSTFGCP